MRKEGIVWKTFKVLVILLGMVLILGPIFVIFINSMKTMQEAGRNFFALPSGLNFDNYKELFGRSDFWSSFRNSTIVTVTSVTLIVLIIRMQWQEISIKNIIRCCIIIFWQVYLFRSRY